LRLWRRAAYVAILHRNKCVIGAIQTMASDRNDEPVIIKKYANRRLYHTGASKYVTQDYLAQMVRDGVDFVVQDAKTGEDLTRSVLTQIILEEEGKGETLLPLSFLRQLIALYGGGMETVVPQYLETSMAAFAAQQDKWREYLTGQMGPKEAFSAFEDLTRQNMEMFQNAAKMFTRGLGAPAPARARRDAAGDSTDIDALRDQLAAMQAQLDALSKRG